jgi:hypothetical protein
MIVKILFFIIILCLIWLYFAPAPPDKKIILSGQIAGVSDSGELYNDPRLQPLLNNKMMSPDYSLEMEKIKSSTPSTQMQLLQTPAYPSIAT